MDTDNNPISPKTPEASPESQPEKTTIDAPAVAPVAAAEKPKDRLISKPGNETIQTIVPERTMRIGGGSSAVARSLTQGLTKTSTRTKINRLLGEGKHEQSAATTTDSIDLVRAHTRAAAVYETTAAKLLSAPSSGGITEKIARTSAAATLGMYQFQRTTSLSYMSKDLANSLRQTAISLDTYALLRAGFTMMERKMNALIINTAAPDAVKRTIYDIVKETLVREATGAASSFIVGKYKTHIGPAVTKYITDPALKKASAYMADENTLGGKALGAAKRYRTNAALKIKRHMGVADGEEMTSDIFWGYTNDRLKDGKALAKDYVKRRGVVGSASDLFTGRPLQNALLRGGVNLYRAAKDTANSKGVSPSNTVSSIKSGLYDAIKKSKIQNITTDDVRDVVLGTDIQKLGITGLIMSEGDYNPFDSLNVNELKKRGKSLKARVTDFRKNQDDVTDDSQIDRTANIDTLSSHVRGAKKKTSDKLSAVRSKLASKLESFNIPELNNIVKTIKNDPGALTNKDALNKIIETIRSVTGYSQAERLLSEIEDSVKQSPDNVQSIKDHPNYKHISDILNPVPTNEDHGDEIKRTGSTAYTKLTNDFKIIAANDDAAPKTDTFSTLRGSLADTVGALRNKATEVFSNIDGDSVNTTEESKKSNYFKETGKSILNGMVDAIKKRSSDSRYDNINGEYTKNDVSDTGRSDGWLKKIYDAINKYGEKHSDLLTLLNSSVLNISSGENGSSDNKNKSAGVLLSAGKWGIKTAGALASLMTKTVGTAAKGAAYAANALIPRPGSVAAGALSGMGSIAKYGIDKAIDVSKFGVGKGVDLYGNVLKGAGSAVSGIAKGAGTVAGKLLDPKQIGNLISAVGTIGKLGLGAAGLYGKGIGWAADKIGGAARWAGSKVLRATKRTVGIRDNSDADMTHGVSRRLDDIIDLILPMSKYFKKKFQDEYPEAGSFKDLMVKNKERLLRMKNTVMTSQVGKGMLAGLGGLSSLFRGSRADEESESRDNDNGGVIDALASSVAGGAIASRIGKVKAFLGKGIRGTGSLLKRGAKAIGKTGKIGKLAAIAAGGLGAYSMMGSGSAEAAEPSSTQDHLQDTPQMTPSAPPVRGDYVQPSGANPLVDGMGTGAMMAGSKVVGRAFAGNAAKAAAKTVGKSLLKKIPGVGLAIGTGLAINRLSKGDYVGALGEFASGALSTIPVYGTAASMGLDIWLATRNDPLIEMNVYKALGIKPSSATDDITNAIYKLVETPIVGADIDYNRNMVNLISIAFGFPQNTDVQRFVSAWYNTLAKPVTDVLRKFASQFGRLNHYDPESYTTRIGRSIFQDMEKDDKTNESLTNIMQTFEKNSKTSDDPIIKLIMDQGFSADTYFKWREREKKNSDSITSLASSMSTAAITATSDKTKDGGTSMSTTSAATTSPTTPIATPTPSPSGGIVDSVSSWASNKWDDLKSTAKVGYETAKAYSTDVYDAAKSTVTGQAMSSGNRFSSAPAPSWNGLGSLSQQFESSKDLKKASMAIGYDSTGGTSYGRYQIAAKSGTFKEFMNFLKSEGGENGAKIAEMLESAGNADTGSKTGAVPSMWQKIASSDMGLGDLEHKFIMKTHYGEQFKKLPKDMQDIVAKSRTMQDVLASTSVQHRNYAPGIFIKTFPKDGNLETWITNIYNERKTRFGSSTPEVRASVIKRFDQEAPLALAMLKQDQAAAGDNKQKEDGTSIAGSANTPATPDSPVGDGGGTQKTTSPQMTADTSLRDNDRWSGSAGGTVGTSVMATSPAVASGPPVAGTPTTPTMSIPSTTNNMSSILSQVPPPAVNVAAPEMPTQELDMLNTTNEQQLQQLVMLNSNLTKMLSSLTQQSPHQSESNAAPATTADSTNTGSVLYTGPKTNTYATNTNSISLSKRG